MRLKVATVASLHIRCKLPMGVMMNLLERDGPAPAGPAANIHQVPSQWTYPVVTHSLAHLLTQPNKVSDDGRT